MLGPAVTQRVVARSAALVARGAQPAIGRERLHPGTRLRGREHRSVGRGDHARALEALAALLAAAVADGDEYVAEVRDGARQ